MTQASFASAGVRRNVLARIAAGGPGFGPKAFNVKSALTSCAGQVRRAVETPSSHEDRQFVPTLNDDRLGNQRVEAGRSFQLIDGVFQERLGCGVANEKTPVLDPKIIVENGLGRGVHLGDKPVLIEGDRGQAHRIERRGWRSGRSTRSRDGGDLDQAPGEGSKNTLLLGAQIADLRIHVKKIHFNTWIALK